MRTRLASNYKDRHDMQEAETILHRCVHCGFCTATCPTFQLIGDELDGPRGRIYLIKQVLEGAKPTTTSWTHLDRCLTCLACETTCPSGVEYSKLLEAGRTLHAEQLKRPAWESTYRYLLRKFITVPDRFQLLLSAAHRMKLLLPASLTNKLPPMPVQQDAAVKQSHDRTVILLRGCAQQVTAPQINKAAERALGKLDIETVTADDVCCGAMSHHLDAGSEALGMARHNIDAWWPLIEHGAEAIVITASGCATMVHEYGRLLADDPDYAERAAHVSALCRDPVELIEQMPGQFKQKPGIPHRIAYHAPCTQQHGLKIRDRVERQLAMAGYQLVPHRDGHLCCGSAGAYSLLQPRISSQLKQNKLQRLQEKEPELIATANIGCLMHLQSGTETPVKHWLELLD